MKKLALHWQILLGMALGVVFALIMSQFDFGKQFVSDWIKPFGNIFINALKLIAVPLILASLIKGVSDLKDISKLSQMGGQYDRNLFNNHRHCSIYWIGCSKHCSTGKDHFRANT